LKGGLQSGVVSLEEGNLIATTSTMKKWPSKWDGLSGDKVGNLVVFYCLTVHLRSGLSWVTFDGKDLN